MNPVSNAKVLRYMIHIPDAPADVNVVKERCVVRKLGQVPDQFDGRESMPDPFYVDLESGLQVRIDYSFHLPENGLSTRRSAFTVGVNLPEGDLKVSLVEVDPVIDASFEIVNDDVPPIQPGQTVPAKDTAPAVDASPIPTYPPQQPVTEVQVPPLGENAAD